MGERIVYDLPCLLYKIHTRRIPAFVSVASRLETEDFQAYKARSSIGSERMLIPVCTVDSSRLDPVGPDFYTRPEAFEPEQEVGARHVIPGSNKDGRLVWGDVHKFISCHYKAL